MPSDDRGAALLEVLMAVLILGIAAAAVLGGLTTSISVSDVHRKQATAGAVARDYAEKIAGSAYVECADPSTYAVAPAAVPVPSGYSADVASVEYWNSSSQAWASSCTSSGLQRVTVVAASADGRGSERSVVVVRKP
jgi:Tfp pilus assembly protein PilV